jgi:cobalt/nickel transport system permease protein
LLQAILFQYGGLTSLGVNTVVMSLPAVICFLAFRAGVRSDSHSVSMASAFMCGFGSVLMGSFLAALALVFTGGHFLTVAKVIVVAHLPVMVIEGIIAVVFVRFLKKVKPEILEVIYADSKSG